jgi:hypothetical protein
MFLPVQPVVNLFERERTRPAHDPVARRPA